MYVTPKATYDFDNLAKVTKVIVKNLNKIIDINFYPVPEVRAAAALCPHPHLPQFSPQVPMYFTVLYKVCKDVFPIFCRLSTPTRGTGPSALACRAWRTLLS